MGLNCKIGDIVHAVDVRNSDLQCDNLLGLSMTKEFRPSTSNIVGTDLSKYKIVGFNEFAVDFMSAIRVHKMPIALNRTGSDIIVSPAYGVFAVNDEDVVLPEYLMLWFMRPDFDRYADFKSDSAIRGGYDWYELCDTEINLPPISEQRKIVHDYKVITGRIELLRKMNEKLEEQEDAIFQDFYSDDSLNEGHFSDLVVDNISGDWGSDSATGNTNAQVTCIRGADIPRLANGGTDNAPTRYILQKNYLSKSLPANALIIEISGGSPTQSTGRIALLTDELRAKLNSRVICSNFCKAITVKEDFLYFFYLAWRHLYKANRLFDYENSTIGLKNFDYQSFVTQEAIRIPTAEGGRRLNAMIEPIRKAIILNGFESEKLMTLQTVVLPNIMR